MVVVIFGRELLITVLRSLSASQGQVIAATPFGKTKMVSQVVAVLLLILQQPYPALQTWATVIVGFAVAFTVSSGIDYVWRFRHVLLRPAPEPRIITVAPGSEPPTASSPVDPRVRDLNERLGAVGLKLAVAESCTGGLLAAAITDQPGSSAYFMGGVVAYSNEVKEALLGVPAEVIRRHNVSCEGWFPGYTPPARS